MTEGSFQTFMTAGLLLLVASILAVGWLLWSMRDAREEAETAALEGVTHELRLNLQRLLGELMRLSGGAAYTAGALMEVRHPQLDAVNGKLVHCDRRALAVIGETYQEIEAHKRYLQSALEAGHSGKDEYDNAVQAAIDGVSTLYMWDAHDGCRPIDARPARSWDVRKWMKSNGFGQFELPNIHLRDAVVDRLRQYGMTLTPKPLTHTAYEYWSLRYDRDKDPNGWLGKRRVEDPLEDDEKDGLVTLGDDQPGEYADVATKGVEGLGEAPAGPEIKQPA